MAAMKIAFAFLVAACVFMLADCKTQEEMKEIKKKCRAESNVTEEMFDEVEKNPWSDNVKEELKCFVKCFFMNIGVMSADGQFLNPEEDEIEKKKAQEEIEPCLSVRGKNLCDTAFKFKRCLQTENDKKRRKG